MPKVKKGPIQPYEARVIRIPFKIKQPNGEFTTGMSTVGIRVELERGEYWFYSLKHDSWTNHLPGLPLTYRTGEPTGEIGPERKRGPYRGDRELRTRLGHAKLSSGEFLTKTLVLLRNGVMPKK